MALDRAPSLILVPAPTEGEPAARDGGLEDVRWFTLDATRAAGRAET